MSLAGWMFIAGGLCLLQIGLFAFFAVRDYGRAKNGGNIGKAISLDGILLVLAIASGVVFFLIYQVWESQMQFMGLV